MNEKTLKERLERVEGYSQDQLWFISQSQAMKEVNDKLFFLRKESLRGDVEETPAWIEGEPGAGQDGIARMIHLGSRRGKGAWLVVNCAETTQDALERELFGDEQRSGVFELADDGTVYLDNVDYLSDELQQKIWQVVQSGKVTSRYHDRTTAFQARLIGGVHNNPEDGQYVTSNHSVDSPFFQYLKKFQVHVPPLRERHEDVLPLAKQFAEKAFHAYGKSFHGFSPDAEKALKSYSWPGNIWELYLTVARAALVFDQERAIVPADIGLPEHSIATQANAQGGQPGLEAIVSPQVSPDEVGMTHGYMELKKKWTEHFERNYLIAALQRHSGNVSAAAREAQIDRSNFLRLLRRHGLRAQEFRQAAA